MREILLAALIAGQFGLASVSETPITIELYAMNCQKVADFTAITVIIPEDSYMIYRSDKQSLKASTWKLEGIQEIRVTAKKNKWIFVRGKDGKFKEVEQSVCGTIIS
ncbi:MAG: hypothetical protein V3U54_07900 [Thermodesulfobacteriota bacterium]